MKKYYYIKTSKLEGKFANILKSMGIKYKRQFHLNGKFYDFLLPDYRLVIEVMGDYWHGNRRMYNKLSKMQIKNKMNDNYKKNLAIFNRYNYIDLWEHEINNNPSSIKRKIMDKILLIENKK